MRKGRDVDFYIAKQSVCYVCVRDLYLGAAQMFGFPELAFSAGFLIPLKGLVGLSQTSWSAAAAGERKTYLKLWAKQKLSNLSALLLIDSRWAILIIMFHIREEKKHVD